MDKLIDQVLHNESLFRRIQDKEGWLSYREEGNSYGAKPFLVENIQTKKKYVLHEMCNTIEDGDEDKFRKVINLIDCNFAVKLYSVRVVKQNKPFSRDYLYVLSEYFKGYNLIKILQQQIKFEEKYAIQILRCIAITMRNAINKGVCFRLKPFNVFITQDGQVRVSGFGWSDEKALRAATSQSNGEDFLYLPRRTDQGENYVAIYSLAMCFCHLIYGTFREKPIVMMRMRSKNPIPKEFFEIEEKLSLEVRQTIKKAFFGDYQNLQKFVEDLYRSKKT